MAFTFPAPFSMLVSFLVCIMFWILPMFFSIELSLSRSMSLSFTRKWICGSWSSVPSLWKVQLFQFPHLVPLHEFSDVASQGPATEKHNASSGRLKSSRKNPDLIKVKEIGCHCDTTCVDVYSKNRCWFSKIQLKCCHTLKEFVHDILFVAQSLSQTKTNSRFKNMFSVKIQEHVFRYVIYWKKKLVLRLDEQMSHVRSNSTNQMKTMRKTVTKSETKKRQWKHTTMTLTGVKAPHGKLFGRNALIKACAFRKKEAQTKQNHKKII